MNHGRVKPFKIHHCSRSYSDFLTACTFEKLFCFLACRCKRSTRSVWERSGDDELTSGEVLVVVELANQKLLSYVFGTVYFGFLKPVSCCLFSSLCFNEESNCDFWWITWSAHADKGSAFPAAREFVHGVGFRDVGWNHFFSSFVVLQFVWKPCSTKQINHFFSSFVVLQFVWKPCSTKQIATCVVLHALIGCLEDEDATLDANF